MSDEVIVVLRINALGESYWRMGTDTGSLAYDEAKPIARAVIAAMDRKLDTDEVEGR